MARILIVDDEAGIRSLLVRVLGREHETREAESGKEALAVAEEFSPQVVICDLKMPEMDGLEVTRNLLEKADTSVIVLTAHGSVETAVEAMRIGAFDYIRKPFDVEEIKVVVNKALSVQDLKEEVRSLRRQVQKKDRLDNVVGKSPEMRKAFDLIERVAPSRSTVLIVGESGTGKELIARAIHSHSPRSDKPFVAVNCAAISEELLESDLFGHEKGAFTSAHASRKGKFEIADGGTLFLDEVSEMSSRLQAKLLRVLQEGEVDRVGGTKPVSVDVRILASSNRNLREEIRNGSFREDLYYRLNVVTIGFPPLRERKTDLPLLARQFADSYGAENGKIISEIPAETSEILMRYNWPGNVRELENVIQRAVVLCRNGLLSPEYLPEEIRTPEHRNGLEIRPGMTVYEGERLLILETLKSCDNNRTRATDLLGISVRTLRNKLNEYREAGIEVP